MPDISTWEIYIFLKLHAVQNSMGNGKQIEQRTHIAYKLLSLILFYIGCYKDIKVTKNNLFYMKEAISWHNLKAVLQRHELCS